MKIFHIITREKFTAGYIDFMKLCFPQYEHVFAVAGKSMNLDVVDHKNIIFLQGYFFIKGDYELFTNPQYRKMLREADKVIATGLFKRMRYLINMFPTKTCQKTYLQFWGGDYSAFHCVNSFERKINKRLMQRAIDRCHGIINLIDGEYEDFASIFGEKEKHFVAPMPGSPAKRLNYSAMHKETEDGAVRVLLGNSATPTNCHEEIIHLLTQFKDNDMEILCPLSYGNEEYRKKIIDLGKKELGNKFVPLLDFIGKAEYAQHLCNCDIGIFNNDRQQAMGNINMMLAMGKKIYLRDSTSMWGNYQSQGFKVFSVNDLKKSSFGEFTFWGQGDQQHNKEVAEAYCASSREIAQWTAVFEDPISLH